MAYIGNIPAEAYTNTVKDSFNGTGSATAFTLSQPTVTNDVRVVVENVVQDPTVAYSVSGTTLTFTSAPPSGTANIYVVHLGAAVMTAQPPSEIADATTFASSVTVQGAFTSLGIDDNATSTAITIDSSENVGIGTSSPSDLLELSGTTAQPAIRFTDADVSGLYHRIFTPTNTGLAISADTGNVAADSFLRFDVDGTERMRLDSSGNVLVGTTSTGVESSSSQTGSTRYSSGIIANGVNNNVCAVFNRQSADGEIVRFRKDGTTVGSIASRGGTTTSFIANPASGSGSGIGGSTNMIIPVDESGGANDNALNLGSTSTRFKDLYLSGGVFLGGTGAANKLDDYEEGTFSPTIATSGSSVSYTQQLGSYVKVGRLVSFNMSININVVTSAGSGTFEMAGLPFASASTNINNTRFVCQTSTVDFNSAYYSFYAYTPSTSVSTLRVLYTNDNGTWSVATAANFAIGNSDAIVVTGQYMTNS